MDEPASKRSPTKEITSFVTNLSFSNIPVRGIRTVERAFVDTIGVTLAGVKRGAGTRAVEFAVRENGKSTIIGNDMGSSQSAAVFANATAGHALDFDDSSLEATNSHPSVPMVAPLLAIGERNHSTGRDLLTAYIAGFETQAYLNAAITPGHYEGGWHATSTLGTFGAAVATASLLDLSDTAVEHTLNIAASMPAGLKRNFGSMTKAVHAGQAARSGLTAGLLAAEGIDANSNAISGEHGFFDLYHGDGLPDLTALPELGGEWALTTHGIGIKKYPCCYYTHAAIHGMIVIGEKCNIEPEDVEKINVKASSGAKDAVIYDNPKTVTQAKFSMPYLIAYAAANRTVDLAAFEMGAINNKAVQSLLERVNFSVDHDLSYDSNAASVAVKTTDGAFYEHTQERPPGAYNNPLTDDELYKKFITCATQALSENDAQPIYQALNSLQDIEDVTEITHKL